MSEIRYTAHEMREAANTLDVNARDIIADCNAQGGSTNRTLYKEYAEDDIKFAAMLRQAADMRETLDYVSAKVSECDECDEYNRTEFCAEAIGDIKAKLQGDEKKEEK